MTQNRPFQHIIFMEESQIIRKLVLTCTAVLATCFAGVGFAHAEWVDGGEWDHGNSGGRVWSNYHHAGVNHGSSVNGHEYVDSGCQLPGIWARAQAASRWLGASGAYYRHC